MPTALWTDTERSLVDGENIITQSTSGNGVTVTTLTFNPLKTSDDGEYVCSGALVTPAEPVELQVNTRELLQVQSRLLFIPITFAINFLLIQLPLLW